MGLAIVLTLGLAGCGSKSGGSTAGSGKSAGKSGTQYDLGEVIYDQEDVKITANHLIDENGRYSLELEVENNTEETIGFNQTSFVVNGFVLEEPSNHMTRDSIEIMLSSFRDSEDVEDIIQDFFNTIPAGETQKVPFISYLSDTQQEYIGTVQQIEMSVAVAKFTDMEDLETLGAEEMPESGLITLKTKEFDGELKLPEVEGTEIYNDNDIRLVVSDITYDDTLENLSIGIYAENNSGKTISLFLNDMSLNDFVTECYLNLPMELANGYKAAGELESMEELDIKSVDDVNNVEMSIVIKDIDTYDTIDTATYTYEK